MAANSDTTELPRCPICRVLTSRFNCHRHNCPGKSQSTDDPLVADWTAAFIAANGRAPEQVPRYENGWYIWRSSLGWVTSRHRRSELERLTQNLKDRANA